MIKKEHDDYTMRMKIRKTRIAMRTSVDDIMIRIAMRASMMS